MAHLNDVFINFQGRNGKDGFNGEAGEDGSTVSAFNGLCIGNSSTDWALQCSPTLG